MYSFPAKCNIIHYLDEWKTSISDDSHIGKEFNFLTDEQKAMLYGYSRHMDAAITEYLRDGKVDDGCELMMRDMVELLSLTLSQIRHKHTGYVFRNADISEAEENALEQAFLLGTPFTLSYFLPCSDNEGIQQDKKYFFSIRTKSGADIGSLSSCKHKKIREIIIPRGVSFRVMRWEPKFMKGKIYVEMEEI